MFSQSDSFLFINCSSNSTLEEDHNKEDNEEQQQHQGDNDDIISVWVTPLKNLKLEIPALHEEVMGSKKDEDEGLRTPTSSDHKIPVMLECPGAPRKTKSRPQKKRKTCSERIMVDNSNELEYLFPMPLVVDLYPGDKNKKFKQFSGNENKP